MVQQYDKWSPSEDGLPGAQESFLCSLGSPLWAGRSHKGQVGGQAQNKNRKFRKVTGNLQVPAGQGLLLLKDIRNGPATEEKTVGSLLGSELLCGL